MKVGQSKATKRIGTNLYWYKFPQWDEVVKMNIIVAEVVLLVMVKRITFKECDHRKNNKSSEFKV